MAVAVVTGIEAAHEAAVAAALGTAPGVRLLRRCADLADLIAVCSAGRADVAVVSAGFTDLDRSAVASLREGGAGLVGVYRSGDAGAQQVLRQWGVAAALPADAPAADLAAAVLTAAADPAPAEPATGAGRPAPYVDQGPSPDVPAHPGPEPAPVVVVWGPLGAPGRTALAVNLAAEAARLGVPTVLVDADTHAASVAQHLALLDEAPGVAAATRLADTGHLDLRSLAAAAPEAMPGLRVLTGLPRSQRWPEIRGEALSAVLEECRRLARLVVVDVGAALEQDEELSYDTTAPRRNAATLAALGAATTVLAVGSADPVGLQRLVRGLDDLRAVTHESPLVVVNRVRASSVGAAPEQRVGDALQRFAGVAVARAIPDDRSAFDAALLAGRVLAEQAPNSPARKVIAELAAELTGVTAGSRRGWFAARR